MEEVKKPKNFLRGLFSHYFCESLLMRPETIYSKKTSWTFSGPPKARFDLGNTKSFPNFPAWVESHSEEVDLTTGGSLWRPREGGPIGRCNKIPVLLLIPSQTF